MFEHYFFLISRLVIEHKNKNIILLSRTDFTVKCNSVKLRDTTENTFFSSLSHSHFIKISRVKVLEKAVPYTELYSDYSRIGPRPQLFSALTFFICATVIVV